MTFTESERLTAADIRWLDGQIAAEEARSMMSRPIGPGDYLFRSPEEDAHDRIIAALRAKRLRRIRRALPEVPA